jgi:hypothetical protein
MVKKSFSHGEEVVLTFSSTTYQAVAFYEIM